MNQKQKSVSDDIFISNDYNDIELSDESEIKYYSHTLREEDKNELFYNKEDDNPKLHYMQSSSSEYEKHANANINDHIVFIEEEETEDVTPSQDDNQHQSSHNILSFSSDDNVK